MSGKTVDLKAMREQLAQVYEGERLALWMEYTRLELEAKNNEEWMAGCYPHLKVQSWSLDDPKHPRVVFSFTVQKENCNRMGNLHGGCTASLFDFATSVPLTLINKPGFWFYLGVSRTLNVSYLRPIPCGEKILIDCEILSVGRTLCTARGVMKRESDGTVLTSCEHGKFNSDPQPSKL